MTEQQPPNHSKDWQDLPPIDALLDGDEDDDEEDDDLDAACALKQDPSFCPIKDHMDLHATLYHQHVLMTNRSIMPSSANRNTSKMSDPSSSKSKLKPMSGTGTITVVTKTTTTTTITGFPVVDVSSQRLDAMAQHVAQQAPSPNSSCSDSSSSSDEGDDSDADMLSTDSRSEATTSSLSSYRQKHAFAPSYESSSTTSTSIHSQAVSQSTRTPKILKSKSTRKTPMARNKRTTTSYDAKTTAYLKKAFFNYYSKQYKLTREQREAVMRETGLRSRNITYWFSNHKRRLGTELAVYRKLTREHNIKDYDAFVQWRQDRDLPTYITREEIRQFRESQH